MVLPRQKNATAADSDNEDVDVFAARARLPPQDDTSDEDDTSEDSVEDVATILKEETPTTLATDKDADPEAKPSDALDPPRHGRYFHHDERTASVEAAQGDACREKRLNQGLYSHWDEDEVIQSRTPAKQMAEEDGQTLLAQGGKRRYLYDPVIDRNMAWEHDKFNDLNKSPSTRGRGSPRGRGPRGRGRGRGRYPRRGLSPSGSTSLISSG